MKKLSAILMVIAIVFAFAACTKTSTETTSSTASTVSKRVVTEDDETSSTAEKVLPTFENLEDYVVIGYANKGTISSIYDIKNTKIGYVYGTDSEKIAKYLTDDDNPLGFGPEGDAFSKMYDPSVIDYIIVTRDGAADRMKSRTDVIVALDKIEF